MSKIKKTTVKIHIGLQKRHFIFYKQWLVNQKNVTGVEIDRRSSW